MNREIHITKMKLTKGETLEINYDEILTEEGQEPIINHITIAGGHKAHPDAIDAIKRLTIHGAIICEQIKPATKGKGQTNVGPGGTVVNIPIKLEADQLAILDNCQVYGFTIGGDDEKPGAILSMKRRLGNNQMIIINSPFAEFDKENGYKYRSKLAEDIEGACQEGMLYLEGKKAPDPQLDIFEQQTA